MDFKPPEKNDIELINIAFGALLGGALTIGVTTITDFIRRKTNARKFRTLVRAELKDLQIRLCFYYYLIGTKRRRLNTEGIKWICDLIRNYDGKIIDEELRSDILSLEPIKQAQLDEMLDATVRPEYERTEFKKLYLPSLQSGLTNLSYLKQELSRALIDISNEINYYNETIDNYWRFYHRTFDSLTTENHQVVTNNISKAERTLMDAGKAIVDKISKISDL